MTKNAWNCGACGQYYDLSERDLEGFHDSNKCDANDEEPKLVAFDKWLDTKEPKSIAQKLSKWLENKEAN